MLRIHGDTGSLLAALADHWADQQLQIPPPIRPVVQPHPSAIENGAVDQVRLPPDDAASRVLGLGGQLGVGLGRDHPQQRPVVLVSVLVWIQIQQLLDQGEHPGHLRQHHIREVDPSCCDRLQEGSLSNRRVLRVVADQQPYDDVGVKRPHDRLACLGQRRWPPQPLLAALAAVQGLVQLLLLGAELIEQLLDLDQAMGEMADGDGGEALLIGAVRPGAILWRSAPRGAAAGVRRYALAGSMARRWLEGNRLLLLVWPAP